MTVERAIAIVNNVEGYLRACAVGDGHFYINGEYKMADTAEALYGVGLFAEEMRQRLENEKDS